MGAELEALIEEIKERRVAVATTERRKQWGKAVAKGFALVPPTQRKCCINDCGVVLVNNECEVHGYCLTHRTE